MSFLAADELLRRLAVRLARTVMIAAFVLTALSAGRADASCGDWLAGHEATPGEAIAQNGDERAPHAPCDGPECRRSRDELPLAPSGPNRQLEHPERWLRLAEELERRPRHSSSPAPEAEPAAIEGHRPSIERPPRA